MNKGDHKKEEEDCRSQLVPASSLQACKVVSDESAAEKTGEIYGGGGLQEGLL